MSLPVNIADVLNGHAVEWERIEFKGWKPEDIIHTLCAFANDFHNLGGGYLFIGVNEKDGQPVLPPVGLEVNRLDKLQQEILNLGNKIKPSYHPVVEPYVLSGRHILVL